MDTVKQGRTKVKEAESASVPNDYFGTDYLVPLQTVGVMEDRLYGRVVRLINGNQLFVVKWDVEGDETQTCLNKVTLEPNDTPLQRSNYSAIQETSTTASLTHARFEETDSDPQPESEPSVILFVVVNKTRKNCLVATPVSHSGVVHNKEVGSHQGKFRIDEVLDRWEGYDPDVHCAGSFVVWDLVNSEKEKKEKEVIKTNRKKKGRIYRKNRKNLSEKESDSEESGVDYGSVREDKTNEKKKRKITSGKTRKRKLISDNEEEEYEGSDQDLEGGDHESEQESHRREKRSRNKDRRKKNSEDEQEDESDQDQEQVSSKSKRKVSGQDQEEKRKKDNKTKDKRQTRNGEKVTIGKKAADQIRKKRKDQGM